MKKLILYIIVFVLLVYSVDSIGTCEVDKSWNYGDIYHPLETADFSCHCTSPNEEDKAGYMVWINTAGSILQNLSVNSGNCRTSFFFSLYTFPDGMDTIGNVTFSLNGDGTGTPTNWGGATDNTTDNWNVTGSDALTCLITDIKNKGVIGSYGALEFVVLDGITENPILHSECSLHVDDIDSNPFAHYVEGGIAHHIQTDSEGHALFYADFTKRFWAVNTTYEIHISCDCLPNGTGIDGELLCYDATKGGSFDEKYCHATTELTTGSDDFRPSNIQGTNMVAVFIGLILMFTFFIYLSRLFKDDFEGLKDYKEWIAPIRFLFISLAYYTGMAVLRLIIIVLRDSGVIKVSDFGNLMNGIFVMLILIYSFIFFIVMFMYGLRFLMTIVEKRKWGE